MEYKRVLEDMAIAKKAIADSLLDVTVSQQNLMCEIYCLTSFSNQSFYTQVYEEENYVLLFAKPLFRTHLGISSVSFPFSTIVEAEKHLAFRGDIYCGLKRLPKTDSMLNTLKECLPSISEIVSETSITIDGITTVIINHCSAEPSVLYYRNEATFTLNSYNSENTTFLHSLYSHIEERIGNLIRDTK